MDRPLVMFAALLFAAAAQPRRTIVFMCPHGGAKSLIAASYFNRMAADQHLPYTAIAVAAEDPYRAVPAKIADLLEKDGFKVRTFKPRAVTDGDLQQASKVIDVGCDLTKFHHPETAVESWSDVPMVDEDLPGSAAAIRRRVAALVKQLRGGQ